MELTLSKICGAIVALGYAVALAIAIVVRYHGFTWGSLKIFAGFLVVLSIPLALIWFPDNIGGWPDFDEDRMSDKETPPFLVSFVGWLLLVGAPLMAYFFLR